MYTVSISVNYITSKSAQIFLIPHVFKLVALRKWKVGFILTMFILAMTAIMITFTYLLLVSLLDVCYNDYIYLPLPGISIRCLL